MDQMDKAVGTFAKGWNDKTEDEQRNAQAQVANLLQELSFNFSDTLAKIRKVADEYGLEVYIAPTGYGSGQTYYPKGDDRFEASGSGDSYDPAAGEWYSSSNC